MRDSPIADATQLRLHAQTNEHEREEQLKVCHLHRQLHSSRRCATAMCLPSEVKWRGQPPDPVSERLESRHLVMESTRRGVSCTVDRYGTVLTHHRQSRSSERAAEQGVRRSLQTYIHMYIHMCTMYTIARTVSPRCCCLQRFVQPYHSSVAGLGGSRFHLAISHVMHHHLQS